MRIAVVHSYYSNRAPSGENVVVDLQVEALRRARHDVRVISRHQDEMERSKIYRPRTALRVASNYGSSPAREIDLFDPDVVHVHNLFPNFGRNWVRRYSSRLVATLHNYRPLCAAGTLSRDSDSCTLCPDRRSALPALRHRCYRDSRLATLPVFLGTRFERDPLLASAARIITLNDEMRLQYAAFGVSEEKIVTVSNFVRATEITGAHDGDALGPFWLFVGRLSHEKGVVPLLRDWPVGPRLKVVGYGPQEDEVRSLAGPTVEVLGQRSHTEVLELMAAARGLFFPSVCREGLPGVYLEALAAGLPVVAGRQTVVSELITRDGTGAVSSGSITDDIERINADFSRLSSQCRRVYGRLYTETAWVSAMEAVYADVVDRCS